MLKDMARMFALGHTQNEILHMETIYTPGEMQKQLNELLCL